MQLFKNLGVIGVSLLSLYSGMSAYGNSNSYEAVAAVVENYASFDNKQDASGLKTVLEENFRFSNVGKNSKASIVPLSAYLDAIRKKRAGGGDKDLSINHVVVKGGTASAFFVLENDAMHFNHQMQFIRTSDGWFATQSQVTVTRK